MGLLRMAQPTAGAHVAGPVRDGLVLTLRKIPGFFGELKPKRIRSKLWLGESIVLEDGFPDGLCTCADGLDHRALLPLRRRRDSRYRAKLMQIAAQNLV